MINCAALTPKVRSWINRHGPIILLAAAVYAVSPVIESKAQSCNCPALSSCAPCEGGLTNLTLRFNGASAATITAADQMGTVFSASVNPGASFSFAGSLTNEKFVGPNVTLTVNAVANATFSSLCNNTEIGTISGSFTVLGASSKTGGTLCCSAAMMETQPPVINGCPANISVALNAVSCNAVVNWTSPTATDNCAVESLTPSKASGSIFELGTTTVLYTARDSYGNTSTCSFDVVVTDITDPTITACPSNITVQATAGCGATATWTPPTVSDNCSVNTVSSHSPGDSFPLGSTTVTYTATDASGRTATCTFVVLVEDTVAPLFVNCSADQSLESTATCGAIASWVAPTATDACSAQLTASHQPGDTFPPGTTVVTYTATDNAGNSSTCSFNIFVVDNTPPEFINCPTVVNASAGNSCGAAVNWNAPVATDNCSATATASHQPGSMFPVGTTLVTYTAVDAAGNSSSCSFNVIVADQQPPLFANCPTTVTVNTSTCEATAAWTAPLASDNCSATVTSSQNPGATFPLGTTVVTYTATDPAGNQATCSFNVVIATIGAPVINGCPADISEKTVGADVQVSWEEPTGSAMCGSVQTERSHAPGSFFPVGTTSVSYTFTDQSGNSSACSFNVVIEEEELLVEVAQAITPNGDGHNDLWLIGRIEKFSDNSVRIVDRWGKEVYSAAGYNNSDVVWDGRGVSGSVAPSGTYFYRIEVRTAKSSRTQTGFIELVE